ncbi:CPBP family intramembrane glutamic endopeptidase [Thalassococcus sp. S3]|uniref:CPBP family intramembrane glutamic endopeptidase n=1 Tax=Thalassococcus sp. S3 TaxID=2017482 RepID=UPI0010240E26|nr:CPBP family intramembrane glutamic endopeptidase [Thalassococcus sp. S3]QBF29641.1 hypothetical protein CFI11_00225 [Thalassococcus sp. S3]
MPSRFEPYRRSRARMKAPPPLVTRTGLGVYLLLAGLMVFIDPGNRLLYAIFLGIMALKLLAPVVSAASRTMTGVGADVRYLTGFLLPHAPSLALVGFLDIPLADIPVAVAMLPLGALLFLGINANTVRQHFDLDFMRLLPAKSASRFALDNGAIVLSAIGQELLHRGLILLIVMPYGPVACAMASTATFVLEHVMNRWSARDFDRRAYLSHVVISILATVLVFTFGGVLPAIGLHLGYNIVIVVKDSLHLAVARQAARANEVGL